MFLDATYCKARVGGTPSGKGSRVASQAVVIATGVGANGRREVLGCAVGDGETAQFWAEFVRGLRERGLHGCEPDSVPAASPRLPAAISPWSPGQPTYPTQEFPTDD